MRSLWIGATGLRAGALWVDTVSDNIANVNTTGFRRRRLELAATGAQPSEPAATSLLQARTRGGAGVVAAGATLDGRQGMLEATGQPLDLALEGPGWFAVRDGNGALLLTRAGSFRLDASLRLVTPQGNLVVDVNGRPITVPDWAEAVEVAADGTVEARAGDRRETVAVLGVAVVPNPDGLLATGDGLFAPTAASGDARLVAPGQEGTGAVRAGVVERSNVDLAAEMVDLILAQRMFQLNARVVQSSDEMMALVNRLRG